MSDISIRSIPYVWEEARPHQWEEERVMGMLARRGLAGSDLPAMLGITVEAPEVPVVEVVPVARRLSKSERRGARLPAWRARPLVEDMQKAGRGVAEIAKLAGCSRGTIYRILNDQQSVPSVVVERLEAAA